MGGGGYDTHMVISDDEWVTLLHGCEEESASRLRKKELKGDEQRPEWWQ